MIKLERNPKPPVLEENESEWTSRLEAAVVTYGSYKDIPKEEKSKLLVHYKHKDIKSSLFDSAYQKCAFCESVPAESGNIEVEHFAPKSKYPHLTFEWLNLLPACRKCNGSKDDHDTIQHPIINPYEADPEEVFYYRDIRISARDGEHRDIGDLTIDVCSLNSSRLMTPRAKILVSLHVFSEAIENAMADFHRAESETKRRNRKRRIREALDAIEILSDPSEKYSGFCKSYLNDCKPYQDALELVSEEAA